MQLNHDILLKAIRENLDPSLLNPAWRSLVQNSDFARPEAGHCAIGSEAFYDCVGGAAAGYKAYVCAYVSFENGVLIRPEKDARPEFVKTHWWVRGPLDSVRGQGQIYDVTQGQYETNFPYHLGRGTGFMSPNPPSKRARELIQRVEHVVGADNLDAFRRHMIDQFQKAGGHVALSIADTRRARELQKRFKPAF